MRLLGLACVVVCMTTFLGGCTIPDKLSEPEIVDQRFQEEQMRRGHNAVEYYYTQHDPNYKPKYVDMYGGKSSVRIF